MSVQVSPRDRLTRQMNKILQDVLVLGSMVEQATLQAVAALQHRDLATARRIYNDDRWINEKRYAIENETLTVIATQQPAAVDLRVLASVVEIITELERMGDYAKGIARITIELSKMSPLEMPEPIAQMARIAVDMLHRALSAFAERDAASARSIPGEDDRVDELYNRTNRLLIDQMIVDSSRIDRANHMLWAAHNLERMADRVTNICERTLFVITGNIVEMDISDDESPL